MASRTVGLQLIIFGRERLTSDLAGVLDDVAAAGYQAIETTVLADRVSGTEFRKMLEDRGLVHVGAHFSGAKLDRIGEVVDWLAETGGTDIPLSDNTLREASLDEYRRKGEAYTEAADACRQAGITLSYHNHSWEFKKQDGQLPIEALYEACDPERVKACIDTYWVWDGGVDPAKFVAKHADRLRILHAKDSYMEERGQRSFAAVGAGTLDFPAIMKAAQNSSFPWVVVEQDTPAPDTSAVECITESRRYLQEAFSL